jgi:hypothetical protein
MRKIITIAMLLFSLASYAQGNLQFNQVLNIKNGDNYTVPAGKTLKITSINILTSTVILKLPLISCGSFCNYTNISGAVSYLTIGSLVYKANISGSLNLPNGQCSQCPSTMDFTLPHYPGFNAPVWLKEGEIVSVVQGSGILISAIEFNIVP